MSDRTCAAEGCINSYYCRGLCRAHYERAKRSGVLVARLPRPQICQVDGCGEPHYGRGLCKPHYRRDYRERNAVSEKASNDNWTARNIDYVRQRARDAYWRNREVRREYARKRNAQMSPETRLAISRQYREQNRQRAYEHYWTDPDRSRLRAREKCRRRSRGPDGRPVDFAAIIAEHGMTCHICGGGISDLRDLHFDHVIPLAKGGAHSAENIKPSHALCNMRKGTRILT